MGLIGDFSNPYPASGPLADQIHDGGQDALKKSQDPANHDPNGNLIEYGGLVCKKCDGTLYRTGPVPGGKNKVWTINAPCKKGDVAVGIYHSHPDGQGLSQQDLDLAKSGYKNAKSGDQVIPPNIPVGATRPMGNGGTQTNMYDPKTDQFYRK